MKKFSKLFLSCAAVAALTAAVATAAMAEEVNVSGDVTGTYDTETGKLAITAPTDMDADSQATLLVYDAAAAATEVTADSVVGIDQAADAAFTKNGLKDKPQVPAEGNTQYTVKLGYYADGTFTVKTGTLTLGELEGVEITIGDINGDGNIRTNDATNVLWYTVDPTSPNAGNSAKVIQKTDGTSVQVGDINGDTNIRTNDATNILWYTVDSTSPNAGNAGTKVMGTIVDAPAAE